MNDHALPALGLHAPPSSARSDISSRRAALDGDKPVSLNTYCASMDRTGPEVRGAALICMIFSGFRHSCQKSRHILADLGGHRAALAGT